MYNRLTRGVTQIASSTSLARPSPGPVNPVHPIRASRGHQEIVSLVDRV